MCCSITAAVDTLSPHRRSEPCHDGEQNDWPELDSTDQTLLVALQHDGRMSHAAIEGLVELSGLAVTGDFDV